MIRILVVDDHPAVRLGLLGVLRAEPGLIAMAAAASAEQALDEAHRSPPDVALVDYHLPGQDGLLLAWELKQLPAPPGVIIYSAFASERLTLAAVVAGADALLDKGEPVEALFDAVRTVARGEPRLPPVTPAAVERSASRLQPEDLSIFGMAIARERPEVIASVVGQETAEVVRRVRGMVKRLRPRADGA